MIKKVDLCCLELTNCCNFNCDFCANGFMTRKKGFMDPALAKRIISEASESNFCDRIVLHVMGEPLLHEGLFEILAHAEKVNQKVLLVSNGSLLSRDTVLRVFEHAPDLFVISYHTGNARSFQFRKAPVSCEKYKKTIFDFIELKYQLKNNMHIEVDSLTTLYMPHNRFKIIDSIDELKQFERDWLVFSKTLKKKYGLQHPIPFSLLPGMNHLLEGLTLNLIPTHHYWANTICPAETKWIPATEHQCPASLTQCHVLWNGDLVPCCFDYNGDLAYANVSHQSLIETFNAAAAEEFRRSFATGKNIPSKCFQCLGTVKNLDGSDYEALRNNTEPFYFGNFRIVSGLLSKRFILFQMKVAWKAFLQKVKRRGP